MLKIWQHCPRLLPVYSAYGVGGYRDSHWHYDSSILSLSTGEALFDPRAVFLFLCFCLRYGLDLKLLGLS